MYVLCITRTRFTVCENRTSGIPIETILEKHLKKLFCNFKWGRPYSLKWVLVLVRCCTRFVCCCALNFFSLAGATLCMHVCVPARPILSWSR